MKSLDVTNVNDEDKLEEPRLQNTVQDDNQTSAATLVVMLHSHHTVLHSPHHVQGRRRVMRLLHPGNDLR